MEYIECETLESLNNLQENTERLMRIEREQGFKIGHRVASQLMKNGKNVLNETRNLLQRLIDLELDDRIGLGALKEQAENTLALIETSGLLEKEQEEKGES